MAVIQADEEPRAALQAGRTIRCLTKRRYQHECRRPTYAKIWAERCAEKARGQLVRELGRDRDPAPVITKQLLMVMLCRHHAYFCFDVYLPPTTTPKEEETVDKNHGDDNAPNAGADAQQPSSEECQQRDHFKTDLPIYSIYKDGQVYKLRRNKLFDKLVAAHYSQIQKYDKGGLPYFKDTLKPAFYVDGILQEEPCSPKGEEGKDGEEEKKQLDSGDSNVEEKPTAAEPSPDSADSDKKS